MGNIKFLVLVLMTVVVICSCASPMKKPALNAITQAKLDIITAKDDTDVKKEKLSLSDAETTLKQAELSFAGKDYTDAKSFAEEASEEAKSTIKEARELKEAKEKKADEEKKVAEEKKTPAKKTPKK